MKTTITRVRSSLHKDLIKYTTDSQVHTTNTTKRATKELMKVRVQTNSVQYYKTRQESILLDLITESDIYDNYRYTSCINWEIEKTPEAHPKKLELKIDKPETVLKKIDFNININDNEIDDMNDKEIVHLSDDLIDDDYNNIEDHETQIERTNQNKSFTLLLITNYSRFLI